MKKGYLFATLILAVAGLSLTNSVTRTTAGEHCGLISLGKYSLDLSQSKQSIEIPKDKLVESIKEGLSFAATAKCPGEYEIVNLELDIDAEREVKYQYDHAFVVQMQSMETYMLVRYFNDALKLNFRNIQVKNAAGEILTIPTFSVVVK